MICHAKSIFKDENVVKYLSWINRMKVKFFHRLHHLSNIDHEFMFQLKVLQGKFKEPFHFWRWHVVGKSETEKYIEPTVTTFCSYCLRFQRILHSTKPLCSFYTRKSFTIHILRISVKSTRNQDKMGVYLYYYISEIDARKRYCWISNIRITTPHRNLYTQRMKNVYHFIFNLLYMHTIYYFHVTWHNTENVFTKTFVNVNGGDGFIYIVFFLISYLFFYVNCTTALYWFSNKSYCLN